MARTERIVKKADAIFCADLHLRDTTPECRTDDFRQAMIDKIDWLADLQREHSCPVICGGDVFDLWEVSSDTEGVALRRLPADMVAIPGQHDLPQHSLELYDKSSLHVLEAAGKVKVLKYGIPGMMREGLTFDKFCITGFPYGVKPEGEAMRRRSFKEIAVVHTFVAETVPPFIKDGWTPAQLLTALPGFDVIVAGDHHKPLVYEHRGRLVVVPGSMMRTTADQIDHRPRVYLWYADTNTVAPAYFPIKDGVVSREHLERVEERDARLDAFVSNLKTNVELGLSFEKNMEEFLAKNEVDKATEKMIWEAIDGPKN